MGVPSYTVGCMENAQTPAPVRIWSEVVLGFWGSLVSWLAGAALAVATMLLTAHLSAGMRTLGMVVGPCLFMVAGAKAAAMGVQLHWARERLYLARTTTG